MEFNDIEFYVELCKTLFKAEKEIFRFTDKGLDLKLKLLPSPDKFKDLDTYKKEGLNYRVQGYYSFSELDEDEIQDIIRFFTGNVSAISITDSRFVVESFGDLEVLSTVN